MSVRTCSLLLVGAVALAACDAADPVAEPILQQVPFAELVVGDLDVASNPSGIAPLTAEVYLRTQEPTTVTVEVLGTEPVVHTFEDAGSEHRVPILGLYPGTDNRVVLTVTEPGVRFASDTLTLSTPALPEFFPTVEILAADRDRMEEGWTLSSFSVGNNGIFHSYPFAFDAQGVIRWYLDFSMFGDTVFMVERLANGSLLTAFARDVYELDMLGHEINRWHMPGYWYHHDVIEMPNGNLLVAVDKSGLDTVEDHFIELDRTSGAIVTEWDLRQVLDVDRFDLVQNEEDWFHMNAIWYDERDDTFILSGRNQGVVKVDRNNNLVWILAPHKGWGPAGPNGDGFDTSEYLLTAVDANGVPYPEEVQLGDSAAADFDWVWGQHAPMVLPNGNLFIFDNGFNRNFGNAPLFSRGVEYIIDEEAMTVQQVWVYGEERGSDYYSSIISDVDYLPGTGNRLIMPGYINLTDGPDAYATEVAYPSGEVIFDALIDMKNLLSGGVPGWGQFDIVYRSERLTLYPAQLKSTSDRRPPPLTPPSRVSSGNPHPAL